MRREALRALSNGTGGKFKKKKKNRITKRVFSDVQGSLVMLLHVHCLIHSHEKIFGHMFVHYAGQTTGPASWSEEEAQKLTGDVW